MRSLQGGAFGAEARVWTKQMTGSSATRYRRRGGSSTTLAAAIRALFEHVLAVERRVLPEGHPDLLRGQANLGAVLRELGDLEGALPLLEGVHRAWSRALPAAEICDHAFACP